MRLYLPASPVAAGAPLVVLMHGCGQDAAHFAVESGWAGLANRLGFPLVLPEQAAENNRHHCFRWFRPEDTARGRGEAGSIAAMVRAARTRFRSDQQRVFIAGLSAGGAMAAAMMAAYPELFAAGAVVAGLPVGAASSMLDALARMAAGGPELDPAEWAARARRLAPANFRSAWPRLSVWQGMEDQVVAPANAAALAAQWRALNGLPDIPKDDDYVAGARHEVWTNGAGAPALELWTVPGLGHGYPIGTGAEGRASAHTIPSGVPATTWIARFWGLV